MSKKDMLGFVDLIAYVIIFLLMFICFYYDVKQFFCDNLTCSFAQYAEEQSHDDKSKYVNYINNQANKSVWMWAFYCSAFLSLFVVWWCVGTLIPFITFLGLLLINFFAFYFSMALFQYHFYTPIAREVSGYIESSCSIEDQRPSRKDGRRKNHRIPRD